MFTRWALGLAVVFALLALVARLLQFGFSMTLLVLACLAAVFALLFYFIGARGRGREDVGGPPETGRP